MNDPRATIDQIAERAAEAAPTVLLPKLAAIKNMTLSWADHRRRVNDSHALQMKALGAEASKPAPGDDMGDTIVTGDISIMQPPPTPALPAPAASSPLAKAAMAAALLTGGAGAAIVADKVLDAPEQPPAMVDTDTDTDTNTQFDFGIETR